MSIRGRLTRSATVGLLGAGVAYFFDPDRGKARRNQVAQKLTGLTNRASTQVDRKSRYLGAEARGFRSKLENIGSPSTPPANDQTLVDKVRSEAFFGLEDLDAGSISVDASGGIVTLRGELKRPDQINELERRVRRIEGVLDVVNLLHTPGSEPQNVQEALEASRAGSSLPLDHKPQE